MHKSKVINSTVMKGDNVEVFRLFPRGQDARDASGMAGVKHLHKGEVDVPNPPPVQFN